MRLRPVRSQFGGPTEARQRRLRSPEVEQDHAEAKLGLGQVGSQPDGDLEATHRLVELTQADECLAQPEVRHQVIRPDPRERPKHLGHLGVLPLHREDEPQGRGGHRMVGVAADGLAKARDGLVPAAEPEERPAEMVVGVGRVRREGQRAPQGRDGLVETALNRQHRTQVDMGLGEVGPRGEARR